MDEGIKVEMKETNETIETMAKATITIKTRAKVRDK